MEVIATHLGKFVEFKCTEGEETDSINERNALCAAKLREKFREARKLL